MNLLKQICLLLIILLFTFGISRTTNAQAAVPEVVANHIIEIFKRNQVSDLKKAKVYLNFLRLRKSVDTVTILDLSYYLENQKQKVDYNFLKRLTSEYTEFDEIKSFLEKTYYFKPESDVSEVKKLNFLLKVLDQSGKVGIQTEFLLGKSIAIQQMNVCKDLSRVFASPNNLNQFNLIVYCHNLSGETDKSLALFSKYRNSAVLIKESKNNLRLNEAYTYLFRGDLRKASEIQTEISSGYSGYKLLAEDIELAKGQFEKIFGLKLLVTTVSKKNFYEAVRYNALQKILNQPKAEVLYKRVISFASSAEYVLNEIYSSQLNILLYSLALSNKDAKFMRELVASYEWRKNEGHKNQLENAFFEPILRQKMGKSELNLYSKLALFGGKGHPDLVMASKILSQHHK